MSSAPGPGPTGDFLAGGGEMGALVRQTDWSATALGPPSEWPQSLRTAVSILLNSRYPMFVFWGPELVKIYNEGYRPIAAGKHPWALGRPGPEVWPEIWDTIGPMVERVVERGEATWSDDLMLFMERSGFPEEVYFTFSYSPIRDESGGVGGLFCACTETTGKVLGERRLRTLRDLAAEPSDTRVVEEACRLSSKVLEDNPADIPFSLLYLLEDDAVRLVATTGCEPGAPVAPEQAPAGEDGDWPFATVLGTLRAQVQGSLSERFEAVPAGPWPEPPDSAYLVPLVARGSDRPTGVMVFGIGSRRTFDDKYRDFLSLVAGQIATSIDNARASEAEHRRAEALAEIDRAKTTFFSNVSHELRTPLTLMLGPIEDMLGRPPDEPIGAHSDLLSVAHRNGQRLLKLVNTLLDFSRIEAGRMRAVYEPVELAELTTELASVFRAAVEKAGIALRTDCPPLPEKVYVDRDMWEKIVLNLISNALKFTFEGEIRVSLELEEDEAVLRVRDTGTGIPEHELPRLFQRFHRVEGADGRTHEGTGIGLALVQELVRMHGGSVHADSTLGEGSTFSVRIPRGHSHLPAEHLGSGREARPAHLGAAGFVDEALRWLPEETAPEIPPLPPSEQGDLPAPVPDGSTQRVLVADDNADMRGYLVRLLSPFYEVTAVPDGRRALEATEATGFDLVLSDVMMPGIDGLELVRRLRENPVTTTVPVILLSARADEEGRVAGFAAGADDYLVKPFSARELVARVGGAIALARARQETVTALRESEERFRHMADNAPVMVWVTEPDGTCTYLSKSWYEFTGQTPGSGLGMGWLEAVHPEDRPRAEARFQRANDRRGEFRVEYRLRHRDGTHRWAIDAATPRWSDGGEFRGYVGSVMDITQRKDAEQSLQDSDRRKDEFLATLAHELRNPLAPIRSGLDLLAQSADRTEADRTVLEVMGRQLEHLIRLVDDLLDVSRINRGKLELRRRAMDLRQAVSSAVDATRPFVEERSHRLVVDLPAAPVPVDGDAIRLAQVFSNLLHNAATYTEDGGNIRIDVAEGNGEAVVRVVDDGIGLHPEQARNAFELFTQLHPASHGKTGGLGIGLSLVRRLVQMHQGRVEVESAGPGRGTTFRVHLPLASADRLEARGGTTEPEVGASAQLRVLVVDDNEDAASVLAMLLRRARHEVRTADGGESAVTVAAAFRPDLILMDLGMPRVDGYEACRRIRSEPWGEEPTIVALTGWGQEQHRARTREAGFDHHVVKPIDRAKLDEILESLG